jgi:hypothetical protein
MKRSRWIAIAALGALALSPLPSWIIDTLLFPWVHADPSLFDRWNGHLTNDNGERVSFVLTLHRRVEADDMICIRCNQIEGTAALCSADGQVRRYRVDGSPRDRGGRELLIGAQPTDAPPPDGLELDTIRGSWDGADLLTLVADFAERRGTSTISNSDDPVYPLTLQRHSGAATNTTCE